MYGLHVHGVCVWFVCACTGLTHRLVNRHAQASGQAYGPLALPVLSWLLLVALCQGAEGPDLIQILSKFCVAHVQTVNVFGSLMRSAEGMPVPHPVKLAR